jgi:RNA polymerase sigma-70 factor (ECF subfamily)
MNWDEVILLVDKAKMGDRDAFGQLVVRFEGAVIAAARARMRDAGEAQELAQDVFIHAMRKLPQLRDARCFAGWLRRITARMAVNKLTRKGRLVGAEPERLDAIPARTFAPGLDAERAEAKTGLHKGLDKLKPLDRATLEAFYLKGRSLKQMSREFEVPTGTIKRRLHVARLRLKDAMEEPEADNVLAV